MKASSNRPRAAARLASLSEGGVTAAGGDGGSAPASFAARKPRAAARLATPNLDPATQKIWAEEHALAFTVAGMARDDILAALRDGLTEVIAGKLSREEWLEGARARLVKAGYWREEGEKGGITPSRLQLIFDTNTANAYHGGRWQRLEERRETHPYLMYLTKRDHRVRPEHRAWEGLILPIDHPFWQTHFPPNGFRCRCAVLGVTQAEYDQLRRDGGQFAGGTVKFDNDIDADLEALDPGFAYNPGIPGSRAAALQRLAEEKAARQTAKSAETAITPALPKTAPSPAAPDPGFEHFPSTDRTSIKDAAREANAEGLAKVEAALEKRRFLRRELDAMIRDHADIIALKAKKDELNRAIEEYEQLFYAYHTNCQRCVVAYVLRRQGYDVVALPWAGKDDAVFQAYNHLYSTGTNPDWVVADQEMVSVGSRNKKKALANLDAELERYGEGAQAFVVFLKKGSTWGHTFIAERQNGRTVFVDPQTGKVEYDSWKDEFAPTSLKVARVDVKKINVQKLLDVVKEAR